MVACEAYFTSRSEVYFYCFSSVFLLFLKRISSVFQLYFHRVSLISYFCSLINPIP